MSEIRQIQVDGVNYDLVVTGDEVSATAAAQSAEQAAQSATEAAGYATTASGYVTAASQQATAAANSATEASGYAAEASRQATAVVNYATEAKSYAVGGTDSRTGEDTDNAKYYKEQSSSFATSSATSADNARVHSNSASISSSSSMTSAFMSRSYAVGDTESRTGEETDNAKYYKEQAEAFSLNSEAAANGTRDGQAIASDDPFYQNNAKYWRDRASSFASAANSYKNDAETAMVEAGTDAQKALQYRNAAEGAATDAINAKDAAIAAEQRAEAIVGLTIDDELSTTSRNPVENRIITQAINAIPEELFVAIYGTTTYADVLAAYNAGKTIVVENTTAQSSTKLCAPLTQYNNNRFYFNFTAVTNLYRMVCASSGWTMESDSMVPVGRKINGKNLIVDITLTPTDIDADYVHTDNNFTTELKDKLDGIAAGATVDDHKWNDVALQKSLFTPGNQSVYLPYVSGASATVATFIEATYNASVGYALARYDGNRYLYARTPTTNDNTGKVATTAFVKTAIDAVSALPSQFEQSGKFLTTNGTTASWVDAPEEVFIATYGTTTYDELVAAHTAGKVLIVEHTSGRYYFVSIQESASANTFVFTGIAGSASGLVLTNTCVTMTRISGISDEWNIVTIPSIPQVTGQSGKFLTTNGTTVSWAAVEALPSQTGNSGKFLTTDGTDASWATITQDDHKWNDVTLTKSSATSNSDRLIPGLSSSSATTAYLYTASASPTANAIAKYSDGTPYLNSTTPSVNDSSTKVATTAFVASAIPSNVSSFNNDSGYLTLSTLPIYDGTVV